MHLTEFPVGESQKLCLDGQDFGHLFGDRECRAVVAAWHAKRPLLIRGEPGIGKSQLARAVAALRKWDFVECVITPGTGHQQLRWQFDAVARLAEAQFRSTLPDQKEPELRADLHMSRFLSPGALWKAFRPHSASAVASAAHIQTRETTAEPTPNAVLLIDEIDKADADLPNGLLDELDRADLRLPELPNSTAEDCVLEQPRRVLTIITSNNERPLPPAFERRCLSLNMRLPKDEELGAWLATLAQAAASADTDIKHGLCALPESIAQWRKARNSASPETRQLGVAEFLDLVRTVGGIGRGNEKVSQDAIGQVSEFVLKRTDAD